MSRILVTGGRNLTAREIVWPVLDLFHAEHPVEVLIHGAASGADSLARDWALARGVHHDPYPAKWDDIKGRPPQDLRWNTKRRRWYFWKAGFERNQLMLDRGAPTHAFAFPGGNGTDDMARRVLQARRAGRAIEFLDYRGELSPQKSLADF